MDAKMRLYNDIFINYLPYQSPYNTGIFRVVLVFMLFLYQAARAVTDNLQKYPFRSNTCT